MSDLPSPRERINQVGRKELEHRLRTTLDSGVLSHGWIIAGPEGAGKATLGYRIARAILAPSALIDENTLQTRSDHRDIRLIAQNAHPDLFSAERLWNDKTSKYQSEITVETVRKLTQFLSHTAGFGGARVAIVDTADDLNRNAANALLKALEEPPANTVLLLLSATPGRLLPTIRSRCRRIDLRPVANDEIINLLGEHGLAHGEDAGRIADHAAGRPGYALQLAAENGAEALALVDKLIVAAQGRGDPRAIAASFSARTDASQWSFFTAALSDRFADAARAVGRGRALQGPLSGARPEALLECWEMIGPLVSRGDALNLDRSQIVTALAHDMQRILRSA
ncbi:MAG: DNA polymerase III subunit delta' [Pseudomonadota bacterium]